MPSCSNIGLHHQAHTHLTKPRPWHVTASWTHPSTTHQHDSEARDEATHPLPRLETRSSTTKGLGLFTLDSIPAYSPILTDDALLSLAPGEDLPQLWDKYSTLPPDLKSAFDVLSFSPNYVAKEASLITILQQRGYSHTTAVCMARISSIFQSNAFKTTDSTSHSSPWTAALFPTVARINHSCTPNALAHHRPASGSQVVYAIRDIEAGSELEISYFNITLPVADRLIRAKAWGFECQCPACSTTGEVYGKRYEDVLSLVRRGVAVDHGYEKSSERTEDLNLAIDVAHSGQWPWLVTALPKLWQALAEVHAQRDAEGMVEVERCLQSAVEWEKKISGVPSPSSIERRKALTMWRERGTC